MAAFENLCEGIKVGDPVPVPDSWRVMQARRKFWWLSFDCFGPEYREGKDSKGNEIIRQHERETDPDYKRRVENATPYSVAGPITRQYNNFVFRKPPTLNITTDNFKMFNKNVDGLGTTSVAFWQELLLDSQVAKTSYCLIDTNNNTGLDTMTRAQAATSNLRAFWRKIVASQVLWSRDYMGKLVEAVVLLQLESGEWALWCANTTDQRTIKLSLQGKDSTALDNFTVAEVGEVEAHGFITIPLVRLEPKFGSVSQIAPLAELQKKLTRLLSLLDEELLNSTFSQWVVFGSSGPNSSGDKATDTQEANFGNRRIMFLANPQSSMTSMGADTQQATSLRQSITDTMNQIFKSAGIAPESAEAGGQVESGIARGFKFNDLSANLAALSKAVQQAHREAEIITLAALNVSGEDETPVTYDTDFTLPDLTAELADFIAALNAGLPPTITKTIANRFAERNLGLSEDDKEVFKLELEQGLRFGLPQISQPPSLTDAS